MVDAHGRYKRGNGLEGGGEGVRRQRGRGVGVRGEVSAVRRVHVRRGVRVFDGDVRSGDDDARSGRERGKGMMDRERRM